MFYETAVLALYKNIIINSLLGLVGQSKSRNNSQRYDRMNHKILIMIHALLSFKVEKSFIYFD